METGGLNGCEMRQGFLPETTIGLAMPDDVAVLGAGTMGHGIALVCAREGHPTCLYDIDMHVVEKAMARIRQALDKGIEKGKTTQAQKDQALDNLWVTDDLGEAVAEADVVIEAIPEELDLKRKVFGQVEQVVAEDALLATNTSSLSVSAIAEELGAPERFLGMHFFNPPYIMALVELVQGDKTTEATIDRARSLAEGLGKTPIVVQDVPGFASSRLGLALGLEAIRMVEEDVASPEAIDTAMELGYNHPMGPLKLTDLIGLDVRLDIAEYLADELGDRFQPPGLLRQMVEEGKLGKKSGQGFYTYD